MQTPASPRDRVVVWRFTDGKPGHEKQSHGLLQALGELTPLEIHRFDVRFRYMLWRQLRGHALHGDVDVPIPDLIVGVGHRTHPWMLLSRLVCGGKVVVLMKPSLPHRWFDLVFVAAPRPLPAQGQPGRDARRRVSVHRFRQAAGTSA